MIRESELFDKYKISYAEDLERFNAYINKESIRDTELKQAHKKIARFQKSANEATGKLLKIKPAKKFHFVVGGFLGVDGKFNAGVTFGYSVFSF